MKATAAMTTQQPRRDEFYSGVAGEVDALRVKIAGRAQTDPMATLVMASLDRAHAAAMFAARCDGCKK